MKDLTQLTPSELSSKYQTRDGRRVEIWATDIDIGRGRIIGRIAGTVDYLLWDVCGKMDGLKGARMALDLIPIPQVIEEVLWIYEDQYECLSGDIGTHLEKDKQFKLIAKIPIKFSPGDGLTDEEKAKL